MKRLVSAFLNSMRAGRFLIRNEAAFRQEIALLVVAIIAGWFVALSWAGYVLLVAVMIVLLLVEVLNTGIEAACNAISRDFNADIRLAKDCGSLAVLLAIVLAGGVWLLAVVERIAGTPL
jgi:diacylglycerol kinase (ATP)